MSNEIYTKNVTKYTYGGNAKGASGDMAGGGGATFDATSLNLTTAGVTSVDASNYIFDKAVIVGSDGQPTWYSVNPYKTSITGLVGNALTKTTGETKVSEEKTLYLHEYTLSVYDITTPKKNLHKGGRRLYQIEGCLESYRPYHTPDLDVVLMLKHAADLAKFSDREDLKVEVNVTATRQLNVTKEK
jgi:hypothetical protein